MRTQIITVCQYDNKRNLQRVAACGGRTDRLSGIIADEQRKLHARRRERTALHKPCDMRRGIRPRIFRENAPYSYHNPCRTGGIYHLLK